MLCTSGFVDDVVFAHNGSNRPESKTRRIFHPVRQMAAPRAKSDCILLVLRLTEMNVFNALMH